MADELARLIELEVARTERDFSGVRERSFSVVGVAGGFVSLGAAFLAYDAKSKRAVLHVPGRLTLVVAIALYVVSAVMALRVNRSQDVETPDPKALQRFAEGEWGESGWDQETAVVNTKYLASLRRAADRTAVNLDNAILSTVLGIVATAILAIEILAGLS